jgi:hypothetical protein
LLVGSKVDHLVENLVEQKVEWSVEKWAAMSVV